MFQANILDPGGPQDRSQVLSTNVIEIADYFHPSESTPAGDAPDVIDGERLEYRYSDTGNARRIASRFGESIRWCKEEATWYFWNCTYWEKDTKELTRLQGCARAIVEDIWQEARRILDIKLQKEVATHAKASESASRLSTVFRIVQSLPGMALSVSDFDADPWLLNCENGTVDLRTGELRPHSSADLITKIAPVVFDPEATCPLWMETLDSIFRRDQELIGYFQRIVGYACAGVTPEKSFFVLYGRKGNNGKSMLMNVLRDALGTYALQYSPEMLLTTSGRSGGGDKPRSDLVQLKGVRFAVGEETAEGKRLDLSLVKQLTGGDHAVLSVRDVYGRKMNFRSQSTLFLSTNHQVEMTPEPAMRLRLRVLPFETLYVRAKDMHKFEGQPNVAIEDTGLPAKLRQEASGILQWVVQGCLLWQQKEGLRTPRAVEDATDKYFAEMDLVGNFLADRCDLASGYRVQCGVLYQAYKLWCADAGEKPYSQRKLTTMLADKGISKSEKSTGGRYFYEGIQIRVHT